MRVRRLAAALLRASLFLSASVAILVATGPTGAAESERGDAIRILPILDTGGTHLEVRTLVLDAETATVHFTLDREKVGRAVRPPFSAKVTPAVPARAQLLRVEARNGSGEVLGWDETTLRPPPRPFRAEVTGIDATEGGDRVTARVTVPRNAELSEVAFRLRDEPIEVISSEQLSVGPEGVATAGTLIPPGERAADDWVQVEATLADGRKVEDVELLSATQFEDRLDVHLVQLQALVLDRRDLPVLGLEKTDFALRGKNMPPIDSVRPAEAVRLVLGLSVDSSGSMQRIWPATREAATKFLGKTLRAGDRGFLVDFDSGLRLVQETTDDRVALESALEQLEPEGGTALYDSILFSLLQFENQPGRRGLVVITDGVDGASRAAPQQTVELAQQMGVPIYVLVLRQGGAAGAGPPGGSRPGGPQRGTPGSGPGPGGYAAEFQAAIQELHLFTEPTGGRLFRVGSPAQVEDALEQIRLELRAQYLLTYYATERPEPGRVPKVQVPDRKVKVRTTYAADQTQ